MNKTLNRTNVKPVVNHDSLTSTYDHNPRLYSCRLTARKLRQSNIIRYRDRAPSRVCFKKNMRAMKNRKCRQKVKQFLKHSTPTSSVLNHIATNYKEYYLKFIHRHKFLSQSFAALKHIHKAKKRSCTSHHPTTMCVLNSSTILKNAIFDNNKFCVSDKKLMMSGDIELNSGPLTNVSSKVRASLPAYNIVENKLEQLGLRPLDVGGEGDCFFRAISHQLYGDSNHHLDIRIAGVNYLRETHERFIESNIESSWMQYLANMSTPGTWCDNLVIQAVADILNLKIHIIESDENFALFNIIEAVAPPQHQPTVVHIGHLGEYHYVSTISLQLGSVKCWEK